jgi:hypothetical protein
MSSKNLHIRPPAPNRSTPQHLSSSNLVKAHNKNAKSLVKVASDVTVPHVRSEDVNVEDIYTPLDVLGQ